MISFFYFYYLKKSRKVVKLNKDKEFEKIKEGMVNFEKKSYKHFIGSNSYINIRSKFSKRSACRLEKRQYWMVLPDEPIYVFSLINYIYESGICKCGAPVCIYIL